MTSLRETASGIGILILATTLVVVTAAIIVLASEFVMILFLGVLFGVFLTAVSRKVANLVSLGYGQSLAVVTILLISVAVGGVVLMGLKIEQRLDEMSGQLDESTQKVEDWVESRPTIRDALRKIPYGSELFGFGSTEQSESPSTKGDNKSGKSSSRDLDQSSQAISQSSYPANAMEGESDESKSKPDSDSTSTDQQISSEMMKRTAGRVFNMLKKMLGTTFGIITNLGVIFFVGIFLAVDPSLYRDGFSKLFPVDHRDRVAEVMDEMANSLFKWLIGRFAAMLITGLGTAIGLALLGVPMPITVGLLTGLLTFIPNIGGLIALGIAMLMGLTQGPMTMLWVFVVYACLQLVESNVITPLIQQHQTSIPPALLIATQVIMGALGGFLGILIATPALAATLTLVKEVWIKDTLEDSKNAET